MRVSSAGKIRDHLWLLGTEESCVYLLEGKEESMLISGGMSYLVPGILRQFEEFGIDEKKIKKGLILHAHFDHVGIFPFFKRRNPEMEIIGSSRAWEILGMEKAVRTINTFSRKLTERMNSLDVYSRYDLDWDTGTKGKAVKEADTLDLGDMEVRIMETPGHSSCSISAHVPSMKALFPSDGGGIPFKKTIIPSGNSNYTSYQKNLERLKVLSVDYICADHYGYITGDEAVKYMDRSIELAEKRRSQIEDKYKRLKDIEGVVEALVSEFYRENPDYMLPVDIAYGVNRQIVRHIAAAMDL